MMHRNDEIVIEISQDINQPFANMDNLYWRLSKLKLKDKLAFDVSILKFIRPIAVISLLLAAKQAFDSTGEKVRVTKINEEVHKYLERINFFKNDFAYTTESLPFWKSWNRSDNSLTVVEIARLQNPTDVFNFKEKVEKVLEAWFVSNDLKTYRDSAVKAIVEICNNSIEHSRFNFYDVEYGECYCTLQKYTHNSSPEIAIAIGDLGVGIRGHLKSKYNWNHNDVFYIQKALEGLSGRKTGNGGLGLQRTQEIVRRFGGRLAVKSGKGIVVCEERYHPYVLNHSLKGTQCIINLRPNGRA